MSTFRKGLASRVFIIGLVIAALLTADMGRLFYIQSVKGEEYANKAESQQMSDKESYAHLYEKLETCLEPREREVIILRYGLGNREPLAQREIAVLCGISRSYVSRIEKKALQKLEKALAE